MKQYNFDEIIDRRHSDCVKYDSLNDYFGNADALPLWVADTDFKVPDFIINALQKRMNHEILGYGTKPDSYYTAIIDWLNRRHNWQVSRQYISSSPGVVSAVTMLILALSEPGDKVIVQPPVYFPFFTCIEGSGRVMSENPLRIVNNRYTFDLDQLEEIIDERTKLLILCSPHNPGGMVWTHDELAGLGEICLRKNVVIISDEIHADLTFDTHKHHPLPTISEELAQNCAVCMAPNKTFNVAGLSSAFVVIPNKRLRVKYQRLLNVIHVEGGNIFGNIAMEAAYREGDEWLNQLMNYLKSNLDFLTEFMATHLPKVKVMKPEATFLVWIDFNGYELEEKVLFETLIHKANVALNPGSKFGTGGDGFFRLNIGCPRATLEKGLNQIAKAFANR